jgi:acetylornithine/succinyldiaminopimelate/putrescine aminotransferase
LWAHEQYAVEPDIMTVAKALGGGLPIGVSLVKESVAQVMGPGDHASTFGANPVICAAARVVLEKVTGQGFLEAVREKGEYLAQRLRKLQERWPEHITQVRGRGLIAGAVTTQPAREFLAAFRQRNILVAVAGSDVVRFLPPLVVERDRIDEVIDVFDEILRQGFEREEG